VRTSAVFIDLATESDVPALLALSNRAASATPANFATEAETLTDGLESWRKTSSSYPWLVAHQGGQVVGFAKHRPIGRAAPTNGRPRSPSTSTRSVTARASARSSIVISCQSCVGKVM
jgi:hypothetical protein